MEYGLLLLYDKDKRLYCAFEIIVTITNPASWVYYYLSLKRETLKKYFKTSLQYYEMTILKLVKGEINHKLLDLDQNSINKINNKYDMPPEVLVQELEKKLCNPLNDNIKQYISKNILKVERINLYCGYDIIIAEDLEQFKKITACLKNYVVKTVADLIIFLKVPYHTDLETVTKKLDSLRIRAKIVNVSNTHGKSEQDDEYDDIDLVDFS